MSKRIKNTDVSINISMVITKEGKTFIAYSPALDLSTCASSLKEVKRRFSECVSLFLEELIEAGTTEEVLSDLGWHKVQKSWLPPKLIATESIGITLPAFA